MLLYIYTYRHPRLFLFHSHSFSFQLSHQCSCDRPRRCSGNGGTMQQPIAIQSTRVPLPERCSLRWDTKRILLGASSLFRDFGASEHRTGPIRERALMVVNTSTIPKSISTRASHRVYAVYRDLVVGVMPVLERFLLLGYCVSTYICGNTVPEKFGYWMFPLDPDKCIANRSNSIWESRHQM